MKDRFFCLLLLIKFNFEIPRLKLKFVKLGTYTVIIIVPYRHSIGKCFGVFFHPHLRIKSIV